MNHAGFHICLHIRAAGICVCFFLLFLDVKRKSVDSFSLLPSATMSIILFDLMPFSIVNYSILVHFVSLAGIWGSVSEAIRPTATLD